MSGPATEPQPQSSVTPSMMPPGFTPDLATGYSGGHAEPAANLAGARVAAKPTTTSKPEESPYPSDKTPPSEEAWKQQMKSSDLLVHAKEAIVGENRGLDIGARADEQVFKELERVKHILEGLSKDDPNIAMSHKILMQLYSELETEANRIIAAREARVKQFGEKYRYKVAETVEKDVEVEEDGKKVKKKIPVATGKVLDDSVRIIKNRGQLMTAVTVLDQQQLILSAALEQMLSNNGTRLIEITLPDQKELEFILKEKTPGVPERVKNWFSGKGGVLLTTDAAATGLVIKAIIDASQGQPEWALAWAGLGLTAEAVGLAFAKNSRLAKFFKGEPGQSAKIVFTAPKAEGRVIRTYVDRLGALGQANVAENILAIERLRADIFSHAGLDLQNAVNQAMLRLDLTSLDTGANTLSGGGGEIWLYNKRQYYIREILQKEKHTDHLANLSSEEQLEVVLKAYDLAITEYCGDVVDDILKEHDKPAQAILKTDSGAVQDYADKLARGEMSKETVDKAKIDQAFIEAQVAQSNHERLKGVVERVAAVEQEIPIATREVATAQKIFDLALKQSGMTSTDYGTRVAETKVQTKTLKGEIDGLRSKLDKVKKERAGDPKKNPTGRKREEIDKERADLEKQISDKQTELEAKIEVVNAVNNAEVELLRKTQRLEQLKAELDGHLDTTLVSVHADKTQRRDPAKQAEFLAKSQLDVNKKAAEHARLKGILDSGGEDKHATAEDKLKATQLGYLAAVGSTSTITVGGRSFEGRYNIVPEAIIAQKVTLSEVSSRSQRGFQVIQELYFGTLTPDKRQEVENILTMGEVAKELAAYFGIDKHPSPRLAELLATNTGLYEQATPIATELAKLKKEGATGFTTYTAPHPLAGKSYDECVAHYKAEWDKFATQITENEMTLYYEVVPRLGIDRFETVEFFRHFARRLVDKAKTGHPEGGTFNLSRFEKPTAVREIGETYNSKFGAASVEENQVEGVRREYARYRFTTPQGFKADGIHDTPMTLDLVVGNPQTAGQPEFSREISLVLTPQWWDALPPTRIEAATLGFPPALLDVVYVGILDDDGKKDQKNIKEMGTVIKDSDSFGNDLNSMFGNLAIARGLGGDPDRDTTPHHVSSKLQELTYKSIGDLLIHGDPNRTTRYFERFPDYRVTIGYVAGIMEDWVFRRTVKDFQVVRLNATGGVEESIPVDKFFVSYENIYRRTKGIAATNMLSETEKTQMNNELGILTAELGERAIRALAAIT